MNILDFIQSAPIVFYGTGQPDGLLNTQGFTIAGS